jgi:hypothetical protein
MVWHTFVQVWSLLGTCYVVTTSTHSSRLFLKYRLAMLFYENESLRIIFHAWCHHSERVRLPFAGVSVRNLQEPNIFCFVMNVIMYLSITMFVGGIVDPFWIIFQFRFLWYWFCFLPFWHCFTVSASCLFSMNGVCSVFRMLIGFLCHDHDSYPVLIMNQACFVRCFRWFVATSRCPTIAKHYVLSVFMNSKSPVSHVCWKRAPMIFSMFLTITISQFDSWCHVLLVSSHFAKVSPWGGSNWHPIFGHPRGTHCPGPDLRFFKPESFPSSAITNYE